MCFLVRFLSAYFTRLAADACHIQPPHISYQQGSRLSSVVRHMSSHKEKLQARSDLPL
jgi:hypothetical protein